jgi:hypothetical protein
MKFRTEVKLEKSPFQLAHTSKIALIGSCFSDNIASKLKYFKFDVSSNPLGTIFNPIAVFSNIAAIFSEKKYTEKDLNFNNGIYFSFDTYTKFNHNNKSKVIETINKAITLNAPHFKNSTVIFITLGTAKVYEYEGKIVANCHKVPAKKFTNRLLNVDEIVTSFNDLNNAFLKNKNIVFTVSPVRHINNGLIENNLSKSILINAIHQIVKQNNNCFYFPAYEMVVDDLRDYRFYNKDLVHPNEMAIDYIWEHFSAHYFNETTLNLNHQIDKLLKGFHHQSMTSNITEYKTFNQSLKSKMEQLCSGNPFINFNAELEELNKRIND